MFSCEAIPRIACVCLLLTEKVVAVAPTYLDYWKGMIKQSILLGQKMRLARKEGTRSLLGKNTTKFDSKNELLTFMQSNHNQK